MNSKISFSIPELKTLKVLIALQLKSLKLEAKYGYELDKEYFNTLSSIKGKIERALKDYV